MTLRQRFLTCALLLAFCVAAAVPAHATTILAIDDPSTSGFDYVFSDDDLDGFVTTGGFVNAGSFLDLSSGIGNLLGSRLDLQSINASFQEGAALNLLLTQTDYSGNSIATSSITGSTDGNLTYAAYFDLSNTPFGLANLIGGPLSFGPSVFTDSTSGLITAPGPFSLTQAVAISHPGSSEVPNVTQFAASVQLTPMSPVPEPATLTLLGLGLSASAWVRKRRAGKV